MMSRIVIGSRERQAYGYHYLNLSSLAVGTGPDLSRVKSFHLPGAFLAGSG